jgi:hypothetical protein
VHKNAGTTTTPELLDQLLANYEKPEDLTGVSSDLKALIERALGAELTLLGYGKRDSAAAVTTATAPLFMLARVPYDTKWAAEIG